MTTIPRRTRLYAALLAGMTCVVLGLGAWRDGFTWSSNELTVAVLLFAMLTLADRFQVDMPNQSFHFSVSVGSVLALGAAFTLPPLKCAMVIIVATFIGDFAARLQPIKILVNAMNFGLSTFVAAFTYEVISNYAHTPLDNVRSIAATVVASVVYTIVNVGALSIIVASTLGETPREIWKSNFSGPLVFVSLAMLGSLVPITVGNHPWGILILAVPLAGSHLALRNLRKVELETQATIVSLTDALEFRDAYTHHHSARVTEYVQAILDEMPHLSSRMKLVTIEAARIHDVGKVGIRDTALLKNGPLTEDERLEMQRHPVIGADIVQNLEMYRHGAAVVRHHHERWDGLGYPDGIKGEEIPLGARIIAVADSFDAMTSDRPYRRALSFSTALGEITRNTGTQFDPEIVTAFERAMLKPAAVSAPAQSVPASLATI